MKFNGRNIRISRDAAIGSNVRIGDGAVIYAGVHIGDNATICDGVVLGEPLHSYYREEGYVNPPTYIGRDALIRSRSIIYAGCQIGRGFSTGHQCVIREETTVGVCCSIGTMADIQGKVVIGDYCHLHSNVHVAQTCSLGNFVWMYPFAAMTNDPYPPSADLQGGHIGDFSQVAVHAVILPGVQVGENCLIGASSVLTKAVPPYSLVMGNPAKVVMDVRNYAAMGKGRPYPWMNRFDRGMPWEGSSFERWYAEQRPQQVRG